MGLSMVLRLGFGKVGVPLRVWVWMRLGVVAYLKSGVAIRE